jgi:hypothetical protein
MLPLLNQSLEIKKFDVRMIERSVQRGLMSRDEVAAQMAQLPDDAENAEFISVDTLIKADEGVRPSESSHHSSLSAATSPGDAEDM